jgi:hypothetical protein
MNKVKRGKLCAGRAEVFYVPASNNNNCVTQATVKL